MISSGRNVLNIIIYKYNIIYVYCVSPGNKLLLLLKYDVFKSFQENDIVDLLNMIRKYNYIIHILQQ